MIDKSAELLAEIVQCPNITSVLACNLHNPCEKVVRSQGVSNLDYFQVPEPWNGDIVQAPLLYLSSNPSVSDVEEYPAWSSSDELIHDFFVHRFGGGIKAWVKSGKHGLARDGSYLPATAYWSEILNRSKELFGRDARPGKDYALTEIVHCKSRNMIGVASALDECSKRYLNKVLEISGADIIALIGKKVGDRFRSALKVSDDTKLVGPRSLAGRERLILFLAAPGSNKPRVINKVFTSDEIRLIRNTLERRSG